MTDKLSRGEMTIFHVSHSFAYILTSPFLHFHLAFFASLCL